MSLTYKIASTIVRLIGVKKMFLKNKEEMLEYAKGENAKIVFDLEKAKARATRKNYYLYDRDVMGYRLISYQKNQTPADGEDIHEYMLDGTVGDFTDFPKTYFYYGENECLYAFAQTFKKAMEKYNAPYEMIVGKGMCHCYPLARFFKEGRDAQDEIIELLGQ